MVLNNKRILLFLFAASCATYTAAVCTPPSEVPPKDVVVIGAGMAGLSAGKRLLEVDPTLDIVILERQGAERVGGRVRSNSEAFGVIVEEGANWLNPQTSSLDLATEYGVDMFLQDFADFNVYEYYANTGNPAQLVAKRAVAEAGQFFFNIGVNCLQKEALKLYKQTGKPRYDPKVDGAVSVLNKFCRWNERPEVENLDFLHKWLNMDYEFAAADTSMYSYPNRKYTISKFHFVKDQEQGFQKIPLMFADQFLGGTDSAYFMFNQEVMKVSYNTDDPVYKTSVETNPDSVGCPTLKFKAKRVISTLPVGVLESGDVDFEPDLKFPINPMTMAHYIKVFYKFPDKFWEASDNRQFLVSLKKVDNDGICHHWQNLDFPGLLPGSKILFCSLMSEALLELLDSDLTQDLSEEKIKGVMLDPLRRVFGATRIDEQVANPEFKYFYPDLYKNPSFYGSYENWKIGQDLKNYYQYFGGILAGSAPLVKTCSQDNQAHNGCSSSGDWTLLFSGSASCRTEYGFVHGAIDAGERSANYVLADIGCGGNGCPVSIATKCDDLFINNGNGNSNGNGNGKKIYSPCEDNFIAAMLQLLLGWLLGEGFFCDY